MSRALVSPVGGLFYHLRAARALRRARSPWRELRCELRVWLEAWAPKTQGLVLVGPSGGYCLPLDFLKRFDEVVVLEPDPLAYRILRARAWSTLRNGMTDLPRFRRDRVDYFFVGGKSREIDPNGPARLARAYPGHAVLFCNLLGQLRFLDERPEFEAEFARFKTRLSDALSAQPWASFHDRVSGEIAPTSESSSGGAARLGNAEHALSDAEILARFYANGSSAGTGAPEGIDPGQRLDRSEREPKRRCAARRDRDTELLDHLTGDLAPNLRRSFFRWEISPGFYYLVEAVAYLPIKT